MKIVNVVFMVNFVYIKIIIVLKGLYIKFIKFIFIKKKINREMEVFFGDFEVKFLVDKFFRFVIDDINGFFDNIGK